jgi:hypothetical protein
VTHHVGRLDLGCHDCDEVKTSARPCSTHKTLSLEVNWDPGGGISFEAPALRPSVPPPEPREGWRFWRPSATYPRGGPLRGFLRRPFLRWRERAFPWVHDGGRGLIRAPRVSDGESARGKLVSNWHGLLKRG